MSQVTTAEIESGDGVFTEGDLHCSQRIMSTSDFHNEHTDKAMSLEQLSDINGAGLENKFAKLQKPKAKKIKIYKPLTLKNILDGGGSPGPYLPGPSYFNQQSLNSSNQWM